MKGSKVTFRANIREASVGDSARVYNSRTEKFEAVLPINLWISRPSLNGVLPAYDAAGGGGFPAGTFSKVENGELSLLLEPGRATVHRGTTVVLTIMTNAWEESVRVSGPYGDGAEETAFNYSWKYADGILTLNGLDPDNAERGKILSGQWKPK